MGSVGQQRAHDSGEWHGRCQGRIGPNHATFGVGGGIGPGMNGRAEYSMAGGSDMGGSNSARADPVYLLDGLAGCPVNYDEREV